MTGTLTIIGLGPGAPERTTPAVTAAIEHATDIVGYDTYLKRLPNPRANQRHHATPNRVELERARHAIELALEGKQVVIVSGGDPGVFAMAAAVLEAVESGPAAWRAIDIQIEPGITAMLAAAAHVGAPLGGDFCAISLSDNLKSWDTIERRLTAAASADFVIALYNPASKARPHQLTRAFEVLRTVKSLETVVLMVRAAGTDTATTHFATLATVDAGLADMRTLVIIGASTTHLIERDGHDPWVLTPRSESEARLP